MSTGATAAQDDAPTAIRNGGRLRAIILLAGSVRPGDLTRLVGRSELDLPIGFGQTILSRWSDEAAGVAADRQLDNIQVRVLVAPGSRVPAPPREVDHVRFEVEHDARQFAGTGGVLRDAVASYPPDDYVLVCGAAAVLTQPLAGLIRVLAAAGGDVALLAQPDGTALGLTLASCRALRAIRGEGFVDLKEQALPQLAREFDVRVARAQASAIGVRTSHGYLSAVGALHRLAAGVNPPDEPLLEDWYKTFEIVEDGASVDRTAVIHDSVVLRGSRVEAGAVLVRCVVGPSGVVRAKETHSDRVIGKASEA
jgi:hypothetical protein